MGGFCTQHKPIGPGNRCMRAVFTAHPGRRPAVIEAHDKLHFQRDAALEPGDDAHHALAAPGRHEVREQASPALAYEFRAEHQCIGPVAAFRIVAEVCRSDLPMPMLWPPSSAAKQAGESECGRHNQSIDPLLPINAAVSQSPNRLARVHQLNSIFAIFRVSDHDKPLVLKGRCL